MAITSTTARSGIVQTPTVAKASDKKAAATQAGPTVGPSVVVSVGRGQAQTSPTYGANGRVAGSGDKVLKPTAPRTEPAKQPAAKVTPEPVKKPEPKQVVKTPEPVKQPEPKQVVKAPEPVAKQPQVQSVTKTVDTQRT